MTVTADTIKESAHQIAQETVETRRDLHRHPEIAFEEVRTSGIIADRLEALGLEVRRNIGKTGVIGVLDSGKPGKTVLARADIDALPVHEERDSPYRSTVDGKMHACGHDGHTAVLLSVARILAERKDALTGKIIFIFQPAEETVGGAAAMLAEGALDDVEVDAVIGLHLISEFPTGEVHVRPGPAMAAAESFRIVVHGTGGHAAMPHMTVDPIMIAAQFVTGLQALISRETDPLDNVVISITSVHGGTAHNIIPESVELKGTLRTFKAETRNNLKARIESYAEAIAQSHRGSAELRWIDESPAVVNDKTMTERLVKVAQSALGADRVHEPPPIMGGDDMALWLEQAAGCYFFVGARNEAQGIDKPHHHPKFDIDEAALPVAVEVLTKGILDYLQ